MVRGISYGKRKRKKKDLLVNLRGGRNLATDFGCTCDASLNEGSNSGNLAS